MGKERSDVKSVGAELMKKRNIDLNRIASPYINLGTYDLYIEAMKGIKWGLFVSFTRICNIPQLELAKLLHISNWKLQALRDNPQSRLNPSQSEHFLVILQTYNLGAQTFGSINKFNEWLRVPYWNGTGTPISWAKTCGGVGLIRDKLIKLQVGAPL